MSDKENKLAKLFEQIAALLRGEDGGNSGESKKAKPGGGEAYRFDVVPNGEHKGTPFVDLETDDLEFWEKRILGNLADPARAKWKKNNQRQLDCIRSILKERRRAEAQAELDAEVDQDSDD